MYKSGRVNRKCTVALADELSRCLVREIQQSNETEKEKEEKRTRTEPNA